MDLIDFLFIFTILLSLLMLYSLGGNNAANAFAASVGVGKIKEKTALIASALLGPLGGIFLGHYVLVPELIALMPVDFFDSEKQFMTGVFCVILAAAPMMLVATLYRFPVSAIHLMAGAFLGVTSIIGALQAIHWVYLILMIGFIFLAPLITIGIYTSLYYIFDRYLFFVGYQRKIINIWGIYFFYIFLLIILFSLFLYSPYLERILKENMLIIAVSILIMAALITIAFRQYLLRETYKATDDSKGAERVFRHFQIITSSVLAFIYNAIEISFVLLPFSLFWNITWKREIQYTDTTPWIVLLIGVVCFGLGAYYLGGRILERLTKNITSFTNSKSFAANMSSIILLFFAKLFYLPISYTHTIVGSLTAIKIYDKGLDIFKVTEIYRIVLGWVLFIILSFALSAFFFFIFKLIFG